MGDVDKVGETGKMVAKKEVWYRQGILALPFAVNRCPRGLRTPSLLPILLGYIGPMDDCAY